MSRDDIPTPPDPHRPARQPSRHDVDPGSLDAERVKREAVSALRRVGADRARLPVAPPAPYRPRQDTLRDSPAPPHSGSLPPSSGNADAHTIAALRLENKALREGRKPSPAGGTPAQQDPTVDLPISDAAIGRGVRHLLKRFWPLLVGAVGLGAGGAGALKPTADPVKQDAVEVRQAALERDHAVVVEQLTGVLKREPQMARYVACLEEQLREVGEQALPAPDRMGSAKPPRPFVERCSRLRP